MNFSELVKNVENNGVVGAGGAGFPTSLKLCQGIETIILNCSECEPLYRTDRQLLAVYASEILETFSTLVDSLNSKHGVVAIKTKFKEAVDAVDSEIYKYKKISIKQLDDNYPEGDEVILTYEVTGKIVPEGSVPTKIGVLVLNVETVFNIYKSLNFNEPVINKYLTITGAVNRPVTLKLPIGISINEAIAAAGGAAIKNYEVLIGGPMTGKLGKVTDSVTKTTKCIIVLPANHPVILKRKTTVKINIKRIMSVCSQCQICTDLCPRALLSYNLSPHRVMNAVANGISTDIEAFTSTMLCCECGLCEMYACHQSLSPRMIMGDIKAKLKSKGVKNINNCAPQNPNTMRDGRIVPMDRLIMRLGLSKYESEAPLNECEIDLKKVNIYLKQNAGIAAFPIVKKGDYVKRGQLIGDIKTGNIGAKIHSSINGIVSFVDDRIITVQSRGDSIG